MCCLEPAAAVVSAQSPYAILQFVGHDVAEADRLGFASKRPSATWLPPPVATASAPPRSFTASAYLSPWAIRP